MIKPILNLLSRSASARAVRQLTPLLACCGALVLFAGCSSEPDSHVVSAPPPSAPPSTVMTTTTTTTPAVVVTNPDSTTTATPVVSTTIITQQAPPALQTELVIAQPSPEHVWLAGYWTWRNDQYQWMAGHW